MGQGLLVLPAEQEGRCISSKQGIWDLHVHTGGPTALSGQQACRQVQARSMLRLMACASAVCICCNCGCAVQRAATCLWL